MKLWTRTVVLHSPALSESELNSALALGEESPTWKALMQLLESWKQRSVESAAANLTADPKPDIAAWDILNEFQNELIARRTKHQ